LGEDFNALLRHQAREAFADDHVVGEDAAWGRHTADVAARHAVAWGVPHNGIAQAAVGVRECRGA